MSLLQLARSLVKHRELVWQMTKQEFSARYSGSVLGVIWSFVTPLIQVLAFTFIFGVILKVRWTGEAPTAQNFVVVLFVGMMIYSIFSEAVSRAPGLITSQSVYVKKIVFPLEILPAVSILAALCNALIGLFIIIGTNLIIMHELPATALYLPLVLLPFVLLVAGLGYLLSAAGVYLRDISHVIGAVVMLGLFLSPVFYPISAVPQEYRAFFYLNPLTPTVEQARGVLLFGTPPDWQVLAVYTVASAIVLSLGFAFFQRSRNGFADVL
jgi:lipopolysaccharide transport system permease protein